MLRGQLRVAEKSLCFYWGEIRTRNGDWLEPDDLIIIVDVDEKHGDWYWVLTRLGYGEIAWSSLVERTKNVDDPY